MGAPRIKNNRSPPILCRGRHVADLVDRVPELTISPAILIRQRLVIYIAYCRQVPPRRLNLSFRKLRSFSPAAFSKGRHFVSDFYCSCVARRILPELPRSEPCKMAKANHECAPTQIDSVICCPLEPVDIACPPPRADGPSKRAKKLRAVPSTCLR